MKTPKQQFISQLAGFLVNDQAAKGIQLQVEGMRPKNGLQPNLATEWAALRQVSPLRGYPTLEEAEEQLAKFLS